MELPFVSPVYPSTQKKAFNGHNRFCGVRREESSRRMFQCLATVATQTTQTYNFGLDTKKNDLLVAVQETQRGLVASSDQRCVIEEALVNVEAYNMGLPIDLMKLDGTWRLQYTSAPDVLILLEAAARLPFFQIGQIFQKFECRDSSNEGIVRNVVRWSIPSLLEEQEGATLLVSAKFTVVSLRNIYLQFEEVSFCIWCCFAFLLFCITL